MDTAGSGYHGNQAGGVEGDDEGEEDDDITHIRKRRRVEVEGSEGVTGEDLGTKSSQGSNILEAD